MFLPALVRLSVCLSVCLFVTTITKQNVDGSGRNFLGRFLGEKASPSSFLVTIASWVWRLLSTNAVNRGFLRFSKSSWVEEGREFRFRRELYSQESTFTLVLFAPTRR